MKHLTYKPTGVCARGIEIEMDDRDVITSVRFIGGCAGNTQGVAALVRGLSAREAAQRLRGIQCGAKGTSCPDQLARALEDALRSEAN